MNSRLENLTMTRCPAEMAVRPPAPLLLALGVEDLGFDAATSAPDDQRQLLLNRRSRTLKAHQLFGLATAVAMGIALSNSNGASEGSSTSRSSHAQWGYITGGLYATTATLAFMAPKSGERKSGRTKIHEALAFIHFPAMIATVILGHEAKHKLDRGETADNTKNTAASVLAASFYASLVVMMIPFGGGK